MKTSDTSFKNFFTKNVQQINESHYVETNFFAELCDHLEQKFKIDVTHPESVELHSVSIEDLRKEANLFTDNHHINTATENELVKVLDSGTAYDFMIRLYTLLS